MPDKKEITAVLTVKIMISKSIDKYENQNRNLTLKNPKKHDIRRGYQQLLEPMIRDLDLDGETDTTRHEGDDPSVQSGEGEAQENQEDL